MSLAEIAEVTESVVKARRSLTFAYLSELCLSAIALMATAGVLCERVLLI